MKPKRFWFWIVLPLTLLVAVAFMLVPRFLLVERSSQQTSGECTWIVKEPSDILNLCYDSGMNDLQMGSGPNNEICKFRPDLCGHSCIRLGVSGPCLDRSLFSLLERAEYAFNAPEEMSLREPQTIALIIDTTGATDFDAELMALPGAQVRGETPISLVMEAEIVGPAFEITPSGRQRRELSELNPTRWDWEADPTRSGEHQLEVSLYVIASRGGERIGVEKALAERRVIVVTVPPLNRVTDFLTKIDPILAFLVAIGGAIAAVLAWFGFKNWREVAGGKNGEDKPQKLEVTIKNVSDDESQ